MKIIILAAGLGSRLGTEDTPKALAPLVVGKSILELQLDNLARYLSLADVRLVVGYEKEKIKALFPHLVYIESPLYATQNTAKSLAKGLQGIEGEDVLWLNGDVVFHHGILEPLLAKRQTAMVVNTSTVGEEEVKYQVDDIGRILQVSKNVDDPLGEALGINFFSAGDVPLLKEALAECGDRDYFEHAIQACIEVGVEVMAQQVDPILCVEVDFPEDLERANRATKEWPD